MHKFKIFENYECEHQLAFDEFNNNLYIFDEDTAEEVIDVNAEKTAKLLEKQQIKAHKYHWKWNILAIFELVQKHGVFQQDQVKHITYLYIMNCLYYWENHKDFIYKNVKKLKSVIPEQFHQIIDEIYYDMMISNSRFQKRVGGTSIYNPFKTRTSILEFLYINDMDSVSPESFNYKLGHNITRDIERDMQKIKRAECKKKAVRLREQGFSLRKIANELFKYGYTHMTILNMLKEVIELNKELAPYREKRAEERKEASLFFIEKHKEKQRKLHIALEGMYLKDLRENDSKTAYQERIEYLRKKDYLTYLELGFR